MVKADRELGRCIYCIYELDIPRRGPCPDVPVATKVILTEHGERAVCAAHAKRKAWTQPTQLEAS